MIVRTMTEVGITLCVRHVGLNCSVGIYILYRTNNRMEHSANCRTTDRYTCIIISFDTLPRPWATLTPPTHPDVAVLI